MRIKQVLLWLAIITPFSIFLMPSAFHDFADWGWIVLISVMAVRPISDIFPDFKIFRTLSMLRKEFGIFSGMLLLAHFSGFLLVRNVNVFDVLFGPSYWDFSKFIAWGILGIISVFLVIITSNSFAMKTLGVWWRRVQKLSYLIVIFGGIHIYLMGEESGLIGGLIVAITWFLARLKFVLRIPESFRKKLRI